MDEKFPPKRLSEERKNMLDSLGFVWSLRSKRTDDHWDDMYRQLVEYKAKHGVRACWLVQKDMVANDEIFLHAFALYLSTGLPRPLPIRRKLQARQMGRNSAIRIHQAPAGGRAEGRAKGGIVSRRAATGGRSRVARNHGRTLVSLKNVSVDLRPLASSGRSRTR